MTSTYIAPEIAQVLQLHPYLTEHGFRTAPVREQIEIQSQTLLAAHGAGDGRVAIHILSWWPQARGRTLDDILASEFSASDALTTMCREYGYTDRAALDSLGNLTADPAFEAALDCMLAGDISQLRSMLEHSPHLATARTRYGHGATLLHYLAANGVESHRQMVAFNAAAMAELLLSMGASRTAEANMYGGGQTPYMLASTSAHPRAAGIADQLNRVLETD